MLCADDHAGNRHARVVDMSEITPISDQHAHGAMRMSIGCHSGDVVPCVVDARNQRIPAPYRWADYLCRSGTGESRDFAAIRIRFILPIQPGYILGQHADDLRMFQRDIGPQHNAVPMILDVTAQSSDKIGVHRSDATFRGFLPRFAFAEVKCFVGTDVEFS